jgi:hypothetical protein
MLMRSAFPRSLPARALWAILALGLGLVAATVGLLLATAPGADAATLVPTTTTVTSSTSASTSGQAVTFRATVAATAGTATPVGTVSFRDETHVLGSAAWFFGTYSITVSDLPVGSHVITATYTGDATYQASSASVAQTVAIAATTVTMSSSTNPSIAGDGVTIKAVVALTAPGAGSPKATVVFSEGTRVLGTAVPYFGATALLLPQLPAGPHTITAAYSGDASTRPSSASLTQTILVRPTTASVTTSVNPMVTGQPATLKATVTTTASAAGGPSGVVSFKEGSTLLGVAAWWFGSYALRLPELPAGDHVITAVFAGDATFAASSASLTQQVRVSTVVDVTAAPAPSTTAETVAVTATVRPVFAGAATPTGVVTVSEGSTNLATASLAQGRAVASLAGLPAGDHVLSLRYGGDGTSAAATGTTTLVVRIASTLNVTASQSPSVPGQPVTFTATVLPRPAGSPAATGSVTVMGGVTNHGTATLMDGVASVTLPSLEAGDHVITLTYTGDLTFRAATTSIAHVAGSPTPTSTEPGPLVVTAPPTTFRPLAADPSSPAAKHGGDGGNQIRLPSDGNLLWGASDVGGVDANGVPFLVNNVVSISSPANPLVQRQPLSATGVPFQLVKPTSKGPCTTPGSARVFWNAGMVAIPQAGWDKVLIWFQAYCLQPDMTLVPTSIGLAQLDYTPAMANDMVHPWSDHVRILDEDLFDSPIGMQLPELGPDGYIYVYRCYANGTEPTPQDLLGCKVARVAPLDAADSTRYRYWDGTGWGATSQGTAAYMSLADVASPARMPAGMFKVTYIAQANLWVLGSQAWPGYNGTPLFRVARSPQGPWSVPATLPYIGCGGTTGHVCYGSMISAAMSDATHLSVVYYDRNGQTPDLGFGQLHVVTAGITMPPATSSPGPRPLVPTQTTVSTPTNPSTGGQAVKVTATVVPAPTSPDPSGAVDTRTPAGTVTFREGTTVLGTAAKFFGTYSITLPVLSAGTHTITASFSGDDAFEASASTVVLTVQRASTTLTVASSANPSTLNQPATLSATLAVVAPGAGTPPGAVTFREGTTVLGTATVFFGKYNLVLPNLPAGDHVITASYAGDPTYGPSSVTITQKVLRITTTVGITTSAASAKVGTDVKLSATVTGGPWTSPTGTVTFTEGTTVLGTGSWWFGAYNLTLRTLPVGTHTITARYSGDASFLPGSASTVLVITP